MNENMNDLLAALYSDLAMTDRQIFDAFGYDEAIDLAPADIRAGAIECDLDDLICCAETPIEEAVAATVNLLLRQYC